MAISSRIYAFFSTSSGYAVHVVDKDLRDGAHGRRGLHAELAAVAYGAAHEPAQDIARARVGGQNAVDVADEHDGGADVIGDDAHRLARAVVCVVLLPRERFELCDRPREEVGLVPVVEPV